MNEKNKNPFSENDELDEQLNEFVNRGTLVGRMQKSAKERPQLDDMSFGAEVLNNWWLYFLLAVSSIFTGTLGIMMGIAPRRTAEGIYYNTDLGHLLLAFVYMIAFITVTEFAFGLAKWKYFTREEKNARQQLSMIAMMFISGVSIIATGIAGGMVIASTIAFLTDFQEIPHQAQVWVIVAIPTLMFLYAICGTIYILSSSEAAAKRLVREKERENDLDHATRQKLITQWGKEQIQREWAKVFIRMVQEGKMTAAEAQAAIDAGETLGQVEKRLGRDIDKSGKIGDEPHLLPGRENHREPARVMGSDEPDFPKPPTGS